MAQRKQLAVQVEEQLLEYIRKEPVNVGEKIPNEFVLAEKFEVGRSTIREAVRSLATKGVLEVRRGDGTYVISMQTIEDDPLGLARIETDKVDLALDLLEVRLVIEPEIAFRAAQNASEEDLIELERLCDEVEKNINEKIDHAEADVAFHTQIAKCSGNTVFETLIPTINTAVMTFVNVTKRGLKDETIKTHRMIVDAIKRRDAVGARCAMIMHLNYNRERILSLKK